MDIIYVRDVKGTNFLVLGIIDEVTHLHVGTLLANRTPEEVTKKFMLAWARPFGFPLRLRTDPDGSFRSTFEDAMDEAGVYVDYIPAEAHNKIGLVERHNATYRSLMERIVDAQGVIGYDQMDIVTAMASHAKNSCTWSTGRPPYVAAFGRIPRQGLELLSGPHGLITGQTRSQAQQFADTIRAEAGRHVHRQHTAKSTTSQHHSGSIRHPGDWKHSRLLAMDSPQRQEKRRLQAGKATRKRPRWQESLAPSRHEHHPCRTTSAQDCKRLRVLEPRL